VRDFIKASLVAPAWHESIGNSRSVMKKVWLKFYEPIDDVDCLLESTRKYQNFKVQRGLNATLVPVFKKFQWNQVMMRDDIMEHHQFVEFMGKLAPTVESLDIWNIELTSTPDNATPIDFPLLREFELGSSKLHPFFGKNPRLRSVKLEVAHDESDQVYEFFEKNPQITALSLHSLPELLQHNSDRVLTLNLSRISFDVYSDTHEDARNILKFLDQQRNLEVIVLTHYGHRRDWKIVADIWNSARRCKSFSISSPRAMSKKEIVQFNVNQSVEELKFVAMNNVENDFLAPIIAAAPNLKSLSMPTINKKQLSFITQHLKELQVLRTINICDGVMKFYNHLSYSQRIVNKNIHLELQTTADYMRSSFL
jgi:hypothetical protein